MTRRDIDAVVAGHLCLDIAPAFGEVSGATVGEIFRPGKLLEVGSAQFSTGGPVSNTGLALRRLGITVSLMGKCGDDPFGQIVLELLREEAPGAEAGTRVLKGENTSYTIALVPPGIDRIFLHCPGSNDTFGPEDVNLNIVSRARLFHFGYPPLMKRMYSAGGEELRAIMESASQAGAITSLDMALPDPDSEAGRADWRSILRKTLPYVAIFLPSVEEILFMLRRERFDELTGGEGGVMEGLTADDLEWLGKECVDMGAGIVVIKCGHLGAYLHTARELGGALEKFLGHPGAWSQKRLFEPTCRVEKIASAIGSGDSAIAGFLAAFLRGEPPERCMQFLAVVGAQNLSAVGSVAGVKSWDETVAQLHEGPEKNPVPDRLASLSRAIS